MDRKSLLLLSVLVVGVGAVVFLTVGNTNYQAQAEQDEGIKGKGVYTVYVKDSMGTTTAIRQSDNAVVNSGENCMAKMLFGSDGGDQVGVNVCEGQISEGFRYMGLDEDAQILITDKDLRDPADEAGLSTFLKSGITWNQNSTGSTDALSKVTLRLSQTFTNSGASGEDIVAVGLFNTTGADTRSMLSKANFTLVSVGVGSDITINYDFEVGGGSVP